MEKLQKKIKKLKNRINKNTIQTGYIYECKIIDDDEIEFFYIGSSNNYDLRIKQHLYLAKRKKLFNCNFYEKLREIDFNEDQYEFNIIKIYYNIFDKELKNKEKKYIKKYINDGFYVLNNIIN